MALTLIASFSFYEVPNNQFVVEKRTELKYIRNMFIILFFISTLFFLFKSVSFNFSWKWIKFNSTSFFAIFYLYCICFFIKNFVSLAVLKDELDDEIRKLKNRERNQHEKANLESIS